MTWESYMDYLRSSDPKTWRLCLQLENWEKRRKNHVRAWFG